MFRMVSINVDNIQFVWEETGALFLSIHFFFMYGYYFVHTKNQVSTIRKEDQIQSFVAPKKNISFLPCARSILRIFQFHSIQIHLKSNLNSSIGNKLCRFFTYNETRSISISLSKSDEKKSKNWRITVCCNL